MLHNEFSKDSSLTDGAMDPRRLEMRAVLEEPIGQKYVGQFAKKAMTQVRVGAGKPRCTSVAGVSTRTVGVPLKRRLHNAGEVAWHRWD